MKVMAADPPPYMSVPWHILRRCDPGSFDEGNAWLQRLVACLPCYPHPGVPLALMVCTSAECRKVARSVSSSTAVAMRSMVVLAWS